MLSKRTMELKVKKMRNIQKNVIASLTELIPFIRQK